ncbi:uncharacterized protein LOC120090656 [Benincasa hispida]|uniref:uncharacterized protein LOC120090656 n=1 Tax=Benincasa hispida TaxID=102211 RepID=UPI0019004D94|nr:uncharacterized protein LOC120090656 [Benincasa hispida]
MWAELSSLAEKFDDPWCIGENFNSIRRRHERFPVGRATRDMNNFNKFIRLNNLLEFPLSNGQFTWSREGDVASKSLLDHFLVSSTWEDVFDNSRVARQARTMSDHFPLTLEAGAFEWGPSSFRFCNSWLNNKESCKLIEKSLKKKENHQWAATLSTNLRKTKSALKKWFHEFGKEMKLKEESLLNELQRKDSLTVDVSSQIRVDDASYSLKADLLALYQLEEKSLIQKCKLKWLKEGDENTSFFHRFLSTRKRKNLFAKLLNDQDLPTRFTRDIEDIILGFYSLLYSKSDGPRAIPLTLTGLESQEAKMSSW